VRLAFFYDTDFTVAAVARRAFHVRCLHFAHCAHRACLRFPRGDSDCSRGHYLSGGLDHGLVVERFLRRRAEDRFRLVVEASPNGIVLVNERGRIVLVNTCAEKLFGYGREELIGQTFEILVPERFRAEHLAGAQFLAAPSA
jgi:PAS domain-containing protein